MIRVLDLEIARLRWKKMGNWKRKAQVETARSGKVKPNNSFLGVTSKIHLSVCLDLPLGPLLSYSTGIK